MMIAPETVAEIRRLFYAEHWKVGTIAAALGLHPDTIKHALRGMHTAPRTPAPRLTDPFAGFITQTLQQHPRLRVTRWSLPFRWNGEPLLVMSRAQDETGYVQPSIAELRKVRGVNSIYHNNAMITWQVKPGGEVENVQLK